MGNNVVKEQTSQPNVKQIVLPQTNDIKQIVKETVEEVLRENGLLVESESKSNDLFKFRVGQHIFEGRLTNVKKVVK
jgi:homoaconitase/3-isopropylmalate dehydratase large subunit